MNPSIFIPIVKVFADDPLSVAVGKKIDRPSGDDASQIGAKTFEKCTPAFHFVYRKKDLESLREMQKTASEVSELSRRWNATSMSRGGDLTLVKV